MTLTSWIRTVRCRLESQTRRLKRRPARRASLSSQGLTHALVAVDCYAAVEALEERALLTDPTITSVTDDVSPVTGSVATEGYTNDTDLTVRVSLTGTGVVVGDTVNLWDGNTHLYPLGTTYTLLPADITNDYADVQTGSLLNGGNYNIVARTTVLVSMTESGPSNGVHVFIDTTAPTTTVTINSISLDTGTSSTDFLTKDNNGLTVAATLSASLAVGEILEYSNNGGTTFIDITSSVTGTAVSYIDSSLTSTNTITLRVTDAAGNNGTAASQLVTIDTTAPTTTVTINSITVDSGTPSDFLTNDNNGLTVAATLSVGLAPGEILEYSNNGGTTFTDITSSVTGTAVSYADAGLTSTNTIKLRVTDAAGNSGTTASQLVTIDTIAPTVVSSTPSITSATTATFTVTFSEAVSNVTTGDFDLTLSGTATGTIASVNVSAGTTFVVTVNAISGTGTLRLDLKSGTDVKDAAGNVATAFTGNTIAIGNDNFANAALFGYTQASPTSSVSFNTGATRESGEPTHVSPTGIHSVWWVWTPTDSGQVTISTTGSNFDTLLAIYTGSAVGSLTPVASNDDFVGTQSSVTFTAVAGTAYRIAVDGYGNATGNITLNISALTVGAPPPPAPTPGTTADSFAGAVVIPFVLAIPPATGSLPASVTGNSATATREVGEPNHAGVTTGAHSVWWVWTPTISGQVTIDTVGSNFDTLLAIYTGSAVGSLTPVASNDDSAGTRQSSVTFTAVANTVYHIAVDGFGNATGNISLNISALNTGVTPPTPPTPGTTSDSFAGAVVIPFVLATPPATGGLPASVTGNSATATREVGEPTHVSTSGVHSVWWVWTPTASGQVTIDTVGSNFDTLLAIYTGSAVGSLTSVASNDDFGGTRQSSVTFTAVANTVYHIAVDGYGNATGNITLNISALTLGSPPVTPTPGAGADSFAGATVVNNVSMPVVNNAMATAEAGEPYHAGINGYHSVWWVWSPVSSGSVTINTTGSNFDTLLAVYTGSAVGSLTSVASNDDSGGTRQSSVTFAAVGGTVYYIAVDGYLGATGDIHLNLSTLLVPIP